MHTVRDHYPVTRLDSQKGSIENYLTKTVHKRPKYIPASLIPSFKAYFHIYQPGMQERNEETAC